MKSYVLLDDKLIEDLYSVFSDSELTDNSLLQAAELPKDSSMEDSAPIPEEVVHSTTGQTPDSSEGAGHHMPEPNTYPGTRRNAVASIADAVNLHTSGSTQKEPSSGILQTSTPGSQAPVSSERIPNADSPATHQETAAASPGAGQRSDDSEKPLTSLVPFPYPPPWGADRHDRGRQTNPSATESARAETCLLERRRCGCIRTEYKGNRKWRVCKSSTCETRPLQLSQTLGSSSQSTARPLRVNPPEHLDLDDNHDDTIVGAPSLSHDSAALTEQAASPPRQFEHLASDDTNSDPDFSVQSSGAVSSDPPYNLTANPDPGFMPTTDASEDMNLDLDLIPTAVSSSSDSAAVTALPRVQVNDEPENVPPPKKSDSDSTPEELPDMEDYPSLASRAVAHLPRVELHDTPVPESPPDSIDQALSNSPQNQSPHRSEPLPARNTSSHNPTSAESRKSIPTGRSDPITRRTLYDEDPDAITPAPPLPQGYRAPPVPPAGATPAPTGEQAPFLAVEDAVHKAAPRRPSRPQIAPFTSKQIQEANTSLAAVPAVATASAIYPSCVFNTPSPLSLGAPASSTVSSTRLNTPATTANPNSSFNSSALTTADPEAKPSGWGAFEGPTLSSSSPAGYSGAENAPPSRSPPLLPPVEKTTSSSLTPVEPQFPDYGGVDVGPDAGPMTRFTSSGEGQVVAADMAGYVRVGPQSYPRAMERVGQREMTVGGDGSGGGGGGDGAGDQDHLIDPRNDNVDGAGDARGDEDPGPSLGIPRPPSRRERLVKKVSGAFEGMRDAVKGCFESTTRIGRNPEREREVEVERQWEWDDDAQALRFR